MACIQGFLLRVPLTCSGSKGLRSASPQTRTGMPQIEHCHRSGLLTTLSKQQGSPCPPDATQNRQAKEAGRQATTNHHHHQHNTQPISASCSLACQCCCGSGHCWGPLQREMCPGELRLGRVSQSCQCQEYPDVRALRVSGRQTFHLQHQHSRAHSWQHR
jgi:hypothetical protein